MCVYVSFSERLKKMIETCKELHKGFDEKRLEVKAEKTKRIRELTDPDHAWGPTGGGFGVHNFNLNTDLPTLSLKPISFTLRTIHLV